MILYSLLCVYRCIYPNQGYWRVSVHIRNKCGDGIYTVFRVVVSNNISLTHRGRAMHICFSKIIIGSDDGLSPGRRQAIIWTSAGILLIGPIGTKFRAIEIEIHILSFKKMYLNVVGKIAAILSRPQCVKRICVIYSPILFSIVS